MCPPAKRGVKRIWPFRIEEPVCSACAYRDYATGFEAMPRISGEHVFPDISPRRETPIDNRGGAAGLRKDKRRIRVKVEEIN